MDRLKDLGTPLSNSDEVLARDRSPPTYRGRYGSHAATNDEYPSRDLLRVGRTVISDVPPQVSQELHMALDRKRLSGCSKLRWVRRRGSTSTFAV